MGAELIIDRERRGLPVLEGRAHPGPARSGSASARRIRELTGGEDPDIVFEHPGRETFGASVYVARKGGTIVTCASTSGFVHTYDNRYLWMNLKRIVGSHFANYREAWEANRLVAKGMIHPTLSKVYPLDETGQAAYDVHRNRHQGKVGVLCLAPRGGARRDRPGEARASTSTGSTASAASEARRPSGLAGAPTSGSVATGSVRERPGTVRRMPRTPPIPARRRLRGRPPGLRPGSGRRAPPPDRRRDPHPRRRPRRRRRPGRAARPELDDARARAERLRARSARLASPPQSVQGMSERMRSMLRLAEDEAADMLGQADQTPPRAARTPSRRRRSSPRPRSRPPPSASGQADAEMLLQQVIWRPEPSPQRELTAGRRKSSSAADRQAAEVDIVAEREQAERKQSSRRADRHALPKG